MYSFGSDAMETGSMLGSINFFQVKDYTSGKECVLPLHAQTVHFESALADFRVVPPQGLQDLLLKLLVDEPELTASQLVKALLELLALPRSLRLLLVSRGRV
jgi:hypothetical protein